VPPTSPGLGEIVLEASDDAFLSQHLGLSDLVHAVTVQLGTDRALPQLRDLFAQFVEKPLVAGPVTDELRLVSGLGVLVTVVQNVTVADLLSLLVLFPMA
jgi:hypothetical protein